MAHFVKWILIELLGAENYETVLYEYATGTGRKTLQPAIATIVARYLPIAIVMNEFYRELKKSKTISYPSSKLERIIKTIKDNL